MTIEAGAVAVVIPAHNALPEVHEAIQSALDQTVPAGEIVVVDDDSSDGTGDAVAARFGAPVRTIRGRFGGAGAARNAGWRAARAPWIAFLDADALWFPDKLAGEAAALAAAPDAAWFFSDGIFRAEDGTQHASWLRTFADFAEPYVGRPIAELLEVNFVLTSSVVVRREVLEEVGGFDERRSHAEDLDLWIRLARRWPATASGRALVRYQHLPTGLSRQTERRLMGDVELFGDLAADASLPAGLRRRARHRRAMARYKLAVMALREGRSSDARRHLRESWLFPERALAVASAWAISLLPADGVAALRRQRWATRSVGRQMTGLRRVVLRGRTAAPDTVTRRGS